LADRAIQSQTGSGPGPLSPPPADAQALLYGQTVARERGLPGNGWLVLLDLPLLSLGLVAAALIVGSWGPSGAGILSPFRTAWPLAVVFVPLSLALAALFGLYRPGILRSRNRQAAAGARVLIWSAALSVGSVFIFSREIPAGLRGLILGYHAALGVWYIACRPFAAPALRHRGSNGEGRVVVLGSGALALDIAKGLTMRGSPGTRIVSFIDDHAPEVRGLSPFRAGGLQDLPEIALDLEADVVVVARPDLPREEIIRLSDALLQRGVRVKVLSDLIERLFSSIPFETIRGHHLLQVGETPLRGPGLRAKRAIDLLGAVAGGILILPLLAVIAVAIRLSSPGPILYRQPRIGRGGRPFTMFKFRSMVVDHHDEDHKRYLTEFLLNGAPASIDVRGKKIYKRVDDPRVTPIGHLLRRTSLDELPQLLNVIRGEMALVGPRPCLPFEYDLYEDWQRRRLDVTPGMTGLWQVTGRSYVTFEEMVLLDLFYIGNWSLALDVKLLMRTLPVILFGKGGH
jgi:exopolysaccharide biosynthesis polyprenyl glycosylphosphotransferase